MPSDELYYIQLISQTFAEEGCIPQCLELLKDTINSSYANKLTRHLPVPLASSHNDKECLDLKLFVSLIVDFLSLLHEHSVPKLNEQFQDSLIYDDCAMATRLWKQFEHHSHCLPFSLQAQLLTIIVQIYYDYSQLNLCDTLIYHAIVAAQK